VPRLLDKVIQTILSLTHTDGELDGLADRAELLLRVASFETRAVRRR
jgi:hypothetical protein